MNAKVRLHRSWHASAQCSRLDGHVDDDGLMARLMRLGILAVRGLGASCDQAVVADRADQDGSHGWRDHNSCGGGLGFLFRAPAAAAEDPGAAAEYGEKGKEREPCKGASYSSTNDLTSAGLGRL